MVRTDGVQAWARGSLLWRERDRFQFGHDRGKGKTKEEESTDVRDPAVSENREEKRACAGVLTRVQAGRGKRRKGKGKKRKASRKGKFSFLFLI